MADHTSTLCPKCKGEGVVINRSAQIGSGLLSIGMIPLMDAITSRSPADSLFSYECPVCRGHGWLRPEYRA